MALRALKTDEEIGAVPLDQPVLIELPEGMTHIAADVDVPSDKGKKAAPETDDGSKRLQEQLDAALAAQRAEGERAARAEREAAQRRMEADAARARAESLEKDVVTGGLAAAQSDLAAAKADLVRAGEAGDYAAMADAQAKIGRASAQVLALEGGAAEIAERKPAPAPAAPRQVTFSESVHANPGLMQAEKDWMLRNEKAFGDADFNRKLETAYQGAMLNGLVRGSQAYFDHIERATGLKEADAGHDDERDVNVSPPVSRREPNGDGKRNSSLVELDPEQRDMARRLGVTDVEFARQVKRMEADKKANPEKYFVQQ
ncbi:hypothetical protein [Bradyrhizobium cenepequi]|uniref:hypothetical protein n=1 Tax=Bradyrhizobium cenepequi TaxID=2821403 RepID=UPI001CE27820|nr:hypothetical protein [Bradyrhizobium cenepequi]MCA6108109.1 hypothetical protein [Bradyrhizobium cenepequi]